MADSTDWINKHNIARVREAMLSALLGKQLTVYGTGVFGDHEGDAVRQGLRLKPENVSLLSQGGESFKYSLVDSLGGAVFVGEVECADRIVIYEDDKNLLHRRFEDGKRTNRTVGSLTIHWGE
jgi:hypothetical protein